MRKAFTIPAKIFRPPFAGLAVVVWLYFIVCSGALPDSPIRHGEFPDSDDYMYAAQTLDWAKGQSWYDNVQYRLDPPSGTPLHFFHLAEAPLAALILPLHWMGLGWVRAATIAAAVWPPLLLAGLFAALRWAAESFMPRGRARLTAAVPLFMTPLLYEFMPGHVHHHGLVLALALLAFGCIARMITRPQDAKWSIGAGFLLALGQAIALEILPLLAAMSAWVVLWMTIKGRAAAKAGLIFGLTLFLAATALLMLMLPPAAWLALNRVAYSAVYVLLAGGVAAVCAGTALAAQTRFAGLRYAAGIGLSAAAAGVFFAAFPELLGGPWEAVNKTLSLWLVDDVREATPLINSPGSPGIGTAAVFLLMPVLALAAGIGFRLRARGDEAWLWSLTILLLAVEIALAAFYQLRFAPGAQMFGIIPLAVLAQRGLPWAARHLAGFRFAAVKAALAVLVVFNILVLPFQFFILGENRPRTHVLADILDDPAIFGARPLVIIDTINDGAELLFRTRHSVLAAPYHTDVRGNLDALRFFLTPDPAEAESIARAHHAGLVLMNYEMFATAKGGFAGQLARGIIPGWLKPIELPLPAGYFLFEVRREGDRP